MDENKKHETNKKLYGINPKYKNLNRFKKDTGVKQFFQEILIEKDSNMKESYEDYLCVNIKDNFQGKDRNITIKASLAMTAALLKKKRFLKRYLQNYMASHGKESITQILFSDPLEFLPLYKEKMNTSDGLVYKKSKFSLSLFSAFLYAEDLESYDNYCNDEPCICRDLSHAVASLSLDATKNFVEQFPKCSSTVLLEDVLDESNVILFRNNWDKYKKLKNHVSIIQKEFFDSLKSNILNHVFYMDADGMLKRKLELGKAIKELCPEAINNDVVSQISCLRLSYIGSMFRKRLPEDHRKKIEMHLFELEKLFLDHDMIIDSDSFNAIYNRYLNFYSTEDTDHVFPPNTVLSYLPVDNYNMKYCFVSGKKDAEESEEESFSYFMKEMLGQNYNFHIIFSEEEKENEKKTLFDIFQQEYDKFKAATIWKFLKFNHLSKDFIEQADKNSYFYQEICKMQYADAEEKDEFLE